MRHYFSSNKRYNFHKEPVDKIFAARRPLRSYHAPVDIGLQHVSACEIIHPSERRSAALFRAAIYGRDPGRSVGWTSTEYTQAVPATCWRCCSSNGLASPRHSRDCNPRSDCPPRPCPAGYYSGADRRIVLRFVAWVFKTALLCFQSARDVKRERKSLALRSEGARKRAESNTRGTRHHGRCESAMSYQRTCTHTKYTHIYRKRETPTSTNEDQADLNNRERV